MKTRFEFKSKAERNAFLVRHSLSIAGSTGKKPNLRDGQGRFVGYAALEEGSRQVIVITDDVLARAIKRVAA